MYKLTLLFHKPFQISITNNKKFISTFVEIINLKNTNSRAFFPFKVFGEKSCDWFIENIEVSKVYDICVSFSSSSVKKDNGAYQNYYALIFDYGSQIKNNNNLNSDNLFENAICVECLKKIEKIESQKIDNNYYCLSCFNEAVNLRKYI